MVTGFDERLDEATVMDTGYYAECDPNGAGVLVYVDPAPHGRDVLVCVRESWWDDGKVVVLPADRAVALASGLVDAVRRFGVDADGHLWVVARELRGALDVLTPDRGDECADHLFDDACGACP